MKVLTEINRTGKECIFRIDFACFSVIRISDEVYLLARETKATGGVKRLDATGVGGWGGWMGFFRKG